MPKKLNKKGGGVKGFISQSAAAGLVWLHEGGGGFGVAVAFLDGSSGGSCSPRVVRCGRGGGSGGRPSPCPRAGRRSGASAAR